MAAKKQHYKNALYIKSPTQVWLDIAKDLQDRYDVRPRLWISSEDSFHQACRAQFPQTDIFGHREALTVFAPPHVQKGQHCVDGRFLRENAGYEDIFYNMMDRWSGDPERITMEKRRSYYIDMANAWFAIFEHYQIDLVIIPAVPHRLYDYVAYIVAQTLNVPYIILDQSHEVLIDAQGTRQTLFHFIDNLEDRTRNIREAMSDQLKPSPDLKRYIEMAMQDYETAKPLYFKDKYKNITQQSFMAKTKKAFERFMPFWMRFPLLLLNFYLQRRSWFTRKLHIFYQSEAGGHYVGFQHIAQALVHHQQVKRNVHEAKLYYEAVSKPPDLSQKFVYFAPNFQPERTSTPDAGLCQWVELMVELLAAAVPTDWMIYYKEHPSNYREPIMPDNTRSVGLYKRMQRRAPNLQFMPITHDPFVLIDAAQCVATATGTTAWEAVLRGKPAMIFGETWYAGCPGIFKISSVADCQAALQEVMSGFKPRPQDIQKYLCALETFAGCYAWARGYAPYEPEQFAKSNQLHRYTLTEFSDDLMALYAQATNREKPPLKRAGADV